MVVYLLHFERPYTSPNGAKTVAHYLGGTGDLQARLVAHRDGTGARLLQVIRDAGIGFELARTWEGGWDEEQRLKGIKDAAGMCPLCGVWPRKGQVMRGGYAVVASAINEHYGLAAPVTRQQVHRWDTHQSKNMAGHVPPGPVEIRPHARRTTPSRVFETGPWLLWFGEGVRGPRRKGWVVNVPATRRVTTVRSGLV
jgi:hypothetical protein